MEFLQSLVHLLHKFLEIVLHLDVHLNEWISQFGNGFYLILFAIIFAETGLVVTPFLPGDSLLFALGALCAGEGAFLQLPIVVIVVLVAAFLGDNVNYFVGRLAGKKLFANPSSKVFRKEYLDRTEKFYARHGWKMVFLARFAPILRTFSPFVAGMARMPYAAFLGFSLASSFTWVTLFVGAGYYFGNIPSVKHNFHLVVVAIIVISFVPAIYEAWKARRELKHAQAKS